MTGSRRAAPSPLREREGCDQGVTSYAVPHPKLLAHPCTFGPPTEVKPTNAPPLPAANPPTGDAPSFG